MQEVVETYFLDVEENEELRNEFKKSIDLLGFVIFIVGGI